VTQVTKGVASAGGVWRAEGLEPGTYQLVAEGGYSSRWAQVPVDVHSGMASVEVRLPFLQVDGLVRMGDDPLQALLWFGGFHGAQRVAARSDRYGKFSVILPERPTWRVEVENRLLGVSATFPELEVRRPPGSDRAKVSLDVPDTTVRGTAVDEENNPVEARIRAGSGSAKPDFGSVTTTSGATGKFELRGLAPGSWHFEATAGELSSDNVPVQVHEDSAASEVQLILRKRLKLAGTVVDPAGIPVYGAQVFASFAGWGQLTSVLPEASTDVSGIFNLSLPAGIGEMALTIFPPGFAARQVVVDPFGREPLVIPVSPAA